MLETRKEDIKILPQKTGTNELFSNPFHVATRQVLLLECAIIKSKKVQKYIFSISKFKIASSLP